MFMISIIYYLYFFLGLIMEPNKRYSQTVEKSFHVSMATLDVASAGKSTKYTLHRNFDICDFFLLY